MSIVGIDCGVKGALAYFEADGRLMAVADMPVTMVRVGGSDRPRINAAVLSNILRDWAPGHASVEHVHPRNSIVMKDGKVIKRGDTPMTAGYLMQAAGTVDGVLAALGIPMTYVETAAWRKAGGVVLPKGTDYEGRKEASRRRALQLFPMQAAYFSRVKDRDRAEAALIGWWLVQRGRGE